MTMERHRDRPRRALVTGASRGIGRAVALALLTEGYEVIGTSRKPGALAPPPAGIRFITLDLADNSSIDRCATEVGQIDLLINNAGFSMAGPLSETPMPEVEQLIAVNWTGVVRLTRAFIPQIVPGGKIVNIGSLSARIPVPFVAVYAGIKGAIESFTLALRYELESRDITVVVVEPAFINTDITQVVFVDENSVNAHDVQIVRAFRSRAMSGGTSPEKVAKTVLRVVRSRDPDVVWVVGKNARLMNTLQWLLPSKYFQKLVRRKMGL
ncbi:MAG: SDR family NAD(P)-dependent oxidoreductase [Rhodospirillales bacterium]